MAILSVVEQAYRATIEEQDDTVLWFSHMVKNAGAPVNVLLRSNGVNYALKGQDASGLTIGGVNLSVPPTIDRDVEELAKAGVTIYAVQEDMQERGIDPNGGSLVPGITTMAQDSAGPAWGSTGLPCHPGTTVARCPGVPLSTDP